MAIRVALHHKTEYDFDRLVALSPHIIRLRPAPHNRTPVHRYSLKIEPAEHFLNWQQDPHGNYLARVVVPKKTKRFSVTIDLVADLAAYSPFDFFLEPEAEEFPFKYAPALLAELRPYLEIVEPSEELTRFIGTLDLTPRRTVDLLVDVNRAVERAVKYLIRMEPGVQLPQETLSLKSGSCRDSAWLLVHVLRSLGIAARFVSGYLIQLTPDQKPVEGPPGPETDFTDLHAWCECYVPGAGWIGLDPTSGLFAAEGHIPLAATPSPSSAGPVEGLVDECETEFGFAMEVTRIVDKPRVTKPYTDEQWQAILALGDQIDVRLEEGDARLSVGGEPTFVSIEHPDEPEWNVAALGGNKEAIADRLMRRLWPLWGKGGVLFHGQGKWYPGEQLPRWAHCCYFRTDGVPVWSDEDLIGKPETDYGHSAEDAERFTRRLIEVLGLAQHGLAPAFEDIFYYLWRERRLPGNVDVFESRLEDELERERIARVFRQGLKTTVGWCLPLAHTGSGWISGDWFLREEHLFLIPGDSPMGFRLPIDSQPWVLATDRDDAMAVDPFAPRGRLPERFQYPGRPAPTLIAMQRRQLVPPGQDEGGTDERRPGLTDADPFTRPMPWESAAGIVRTALCVEPRGGLLRIFMPPLPDLEAWLELVGAIETVARELQLPVTLEGYPPPYDPRLRDFKVTPDPGVIEVNVPPVVGFRAVVEQTEELYTAARFEKLAAEKFDIDGTHVGSGGGNHVVMGSLSAGDSPFLRRPDVLASLIRFWHNHPSLSYLFSGRFIGPTSQAPRVDEARDDSVYELEIALQKLQLPRTYTPPWLVDRILRHLLVDITGNTHRAEFCIDKLYSPDSASGRLGLLEMRAFEMPPHERMSVVQQLLVRSLLSVFFHEPYTRPLIHWGTRLHDDFMLPFYTLADFTRVVDIMRDWGVNVDPAWFVPHQEFRFPRYGEVTLDSMRMEIRGALEPWNVLGEETTATGQARYVDSSMERLQVLVEGFVEERYQVVCNGFVVPLQSTEQKGLLVAGIRYRAWQPPSCLHPTVGIHSPLHFDIYDQWTRRSIAGATYHVVHPGGNASDQRPVNAAAAESRRLARFEARGHLAGSFQPSALYVHPHFPRTLDLRRS